MYDPRGMSWDKWCALTAELFAPQQLGTAPEERWREWADGMTSIGYFLDSGVPDSRGFRSWQDWASRLVGIMSIEPSQSNNSGNFLSESRQSFAGSRSGITSHP
jgi:hypothetical protein